MPNDTGAALRDLSWPIRSDLMVYPGDPAVSLRPALTLDDDGVAVSLLQCGSHTGTHVDAPSHTVPGGRTTSGIDPGELYGPALVLTLDASPGEIVGAGRLLDRLPEEVPPMVFLGFGWDRWFGTAQALDHPALAPEAARLLRARGMRVLGTDALSPDRTGGSQDDAGLPVHEEVLGGDGIIVENLRGLRDLGEGIHRIGVFPLPLADADGAPARVIAFD
ncbi:cyclase family protein [Sediminivirga luteola]|uniref:cyclase family protein n=1 Tax=Sediminivirga luteola TaxID=1774748 RepID=UPI001F5A519D|nr:cyclase family protein [Sediminivirga luteola]MCI2266004.1 cyclase family protein [Sediminivirga luteola]